MTFQKYQVVFLFQDEKTFRNFVDVGWKADATAQAAAGTSQARTVSRDSIARGIEAQ